ncbi:MAG: CapA family protein, partial [Wenzhouxiangellaceae bacterium]|nr:CapA family protein [Wenzhouxiangellaceae bacterium]
MAPEPSKSHSGQRQRLKLFLAGDVMTGRGIDQILPHPSDPVLFEAFVRDARDYVELAERRNGEIDEPVGLDYIWGDAPAVLDRAGVDCRIVNLETAVTDHDEPWPRKGINYRMHPANVPVLKALHPDVCALANNHVLDWMHAGLLETVETLDGAGIGHAGAGASLERARAPAIVAHGDRRILVFAFGAASSGIPAAWAAGPDSPGVNFLPDLSTASIETA